ncbi:MAG: TRAP transporter substrate-binding protein DctP [Hyphomicrobiales bacterium]|nr:TRAP transporter substrate-binding protein DctP [Hyphomicrobiales bacterium]
MAFAHVIPVPIVSAHVPPAVTIAVPMAHAVPIAVAVAHAGTVAVPITRAVPIAVAIARAGPVAVPIPRAVAIARAGPVAVTITRAVPIAVARTVLAVFLAAHALATMLAGRAGLIVRVGLPAGSAGLVLPHAGAAGPHAPPTLSLRHDQARPGHKRCGRNGRQENTSHCCFLTCSAPLGLSPATTRPPERCSSRFPTKTPCGLAALKLPPPHGLLWSNNIEVTWEGSQMPHLHDCLSRRHAALTRRRFVAGTGAGLAGILAAGRAPAYAQTTAKKLVYAHIVPAPESAAVHQAWMAEEVTKRSNGALDMEFHGGTLLSKELEIMNAVKAGNVAMGDPGGAAATVFPEMAVFLVPYLVKSYDQAYRMFNGKIGDQLDAGFQDKYKVKVLFFYDYGFRQFWNNKRPITAPKDLRGLRLRVQQAKVFADTINGLGGNAVPLPWGEVIPAAQQGVIDGADLPIVNILALKAYEVSKYCSMTFHNYGPTCSVINLDVWNGLAKDEQKLLLDVGREAQERIRHDTESVDNLAKAKELLEPKGMTVNAADVDAFRKTAQDKIWPGYEKQFGVMWELVANQA